MKAQFEPVGKPTEGVVAYLGMPLKCSSMMQMDAFIAEAYGKDCVCDEQPKGWLRIRTKPESIKT